MELTMLGTGHAVVTECYNTCFVLKDGERHLLVDGGGGIGLLRQFRHAGLAWQDMREIFVTHKHLDHLGGILWMLRMLCQSMSRGGGPAEVRIYGHDEMVKLLETMALMLLDHAAEAVLGDRLKLVEVKDGERGSLLGHPATFFDIEANKAKQYGFSLEYEPGKKLTCCGDEPFSDRERRYAEGADWLLHEAFCLYSEREIFKPYDKHHSTVKDACELAEELGVKNLLLYHTEDRHLHERKQLYTDEGRQVYRGNLFVPDDLETIPL